MMRGKWVKVNESNEWVNTDTLKSLKIRDFGEYMYDYQFQLEGETVDGDIYVFLCTGREYEATDLMNLIMR